MLRLTIPALVFSAVCQPTASAQAPDTLRIMEITEQSGFELPSGWTHILPKKQRAYTNYTIETDNKGPFLRAMSSGTSSWLEYDMHDTDVAEYPIMEWSWMVNQFPAVEWEMNKSQEDFAIRVELVYDRKGSAKNILNIIRKGLIVSIFKGYPPEQVVSYVWALNVPANKPFKSLHAYKTMILPIESDVAMQGLWVEEQRNIRKDLEDLQGKDTKLVLKKIRILSDTETLPSVAESGMKFIRLIKNGVDDN